MWWNSVDYVRRDGRAASHRISRGFWLHQVPRLAPRCRLVGHKPVVDGTDPVMPGGRANRWVVCDRCGLRPDPQGRLDPAVWPIGARYRGPRRRALPEDSEARWNDLRELKDEFVAYPPGPWPKDNHGVLGGQLVIGGPATAGWGVGVKLGNAGSEHTLAGHVTFGRLGGLYLHTERFGSWLQRRFNRRGYQSKVVEVRVDGGRLCWRLWANRDGGTRQTPRWRDGSIPVDPRTVVSGPRRYTYTDVGDPVAAVVRLPHGDDADMLLQLQRRSFGRRRGRKRLSWSVDWECPDGTPTDAAGGDRVFASGVTVGERTVREGTWPTDAAAAIAVQITALRSRNGWASTAAPTPSPT